MLKNNTSAAVNFDKYNNNKFTLSNSHYFIIILLILFS